MHEDLHKRGVAPKVAEGAFFEYDDKAPIPSEHIWVGDPYQPFGEERDALDPKEIAAAIRRTHERQARYPSGLMMVRFPVPEGDPFLFAEQRPDKPIWTGKKPRTRRHQSLGRRTRRKHVDRNKTTADEVRIGTTTGEYNEFRNLPGWAINEGADHAGVDTNAEHAHLKIARYVFPANRKVDIAIEHDHRNSTVRRMDRHLLQDHRWPRYEYAPEVGDQELLDEHGEMRDLLGDDGRKLGKFFRRTGTGEIVSGIGGKHIRTVVYGNKPSATEKHTHDMRVDQHFYARRLSSHPMGFERIADADRVCFALEGCIKEASLVSKGEATFSCPSVTLWDAPELERFVQARLVGKIVLVIPDSDAWENDQVIRQALLARHRLRVLGARPEVAIPTPEPRACRLHKAKRGEKRGLDDYLADGGKVEDMEWVRRTEGLSLAEWIDKNDVRTPKGRRPRGPRVEQDGAILRWIALHADAEGRCTAPINRIADYVKPELERLKGNEISRSSAIVDIDRAVHRMDGYGALSGAETLEERQMWMEEDEWPGELVIHEDLRAVEDRGTVRELMQGS